LFDAHHGVVGPALRPQLLTSLPSVAGAGVAALSETSACTEKMLSVAFAAAPPARTARAAAEASAATAIVFFMPTLLSLSNVYGGSTRAPGLTDWSGVPSGAIAMLVACRPC